MGAAQFADHGRTGPMQRGYMAFVWGVPNRQRGTVDAPIDRHPTHDYKWAVVAGGKPSITHYDTLEAFRAASWTGKVAASGSQLASFRPSGAASDCLPRLNRGLV